jgi:phenylalanyl-tRNA synthetase alpha chain
MREQLEELLIRARGEIAGINKAIDLESWRINYLGRKSELTNILRGLANLSLEDKKAVGARANDVKALLTEALLQKTEELKRESTDRIRLVDFTSLRRQLTR